MVYEIDRLAATTRSRAEPSAARGSLRVALVSGNYNYIMDGAARAQNMLVAHLLQKGHRVFILAPTADKPAFECAGRVTPIPSLPLPGRRHEYRLGLGLTARARAQLDRFGPDIIHIATPDYTEIAALNYAEKRGIPAVASFHTRFDAYPRYYGAAWLEKILSRYMQWFYGCCVHVYPPVQSMLDELKRAGIGKDLRLWRRGVDHELFSPARRDMAWRRGLGFADDEVVVAFVGRLVLEKGIDDFADAMRQATEKMPGLRALVVGDGPERDRFKARLPAGTFVGHQSGTDLARAYASAEIFFNPSVTETAGNVTLEAMASGLACVAIGGAGTISYVRDGETGLLAPAGAPPRAAAELLLQLARAPERRRSMGEAGRALVLSEHRWPDVLDEVIGHYHDAIRSYHSGERAAS